MKKQISSIVISDSQAILERKEMIIILFEFDYENKTRFYSQNQRNRVRGIRIQSDVHERKLQSNRFIKDHEEYNLLD